MKILLLSEDERDAAVFALRWAAKQWRETPNLETGPHAHAAFEKAKHFLVEQATRADALADKIAGRSARK